MSLLIFPIGVALGWFVRPPARAAAASFAVGLAALLTIAGLSLSGAEVNPLDTVVLMIGTPLAAALGLKLSQWRLERRSHSG